MRKKLNINWIIAIAILFSSKLMAQAPANDDCSGAIAVATSVFGSTCTATTNGSTVNGTLSSPATTCATGGSADDDVWYSFTAASGAVVIRISNAVLVPSGTASIGMEVYGGSCASLSSVFCSSSTIFGSGYRIVDGLTTGATYFVRFWTAGTASDANFNFCIQQVPASPANDECSAAIGITTQPYGIACAASTAANTTGATHSSPDASCGVSDSNDDVWYSFTASSASVILRYSDAVYTTTNTTAVLGYALYNSACPATTGTIACDIGVGFGDGYTIINGLTIGHTYYLRLFSQGANNYMSFNFCVQDVPAPPVNNECAGAIAISTQPFGAGCAASISANTTGATHSAPDASCGVSDSNDDIWYSFTAASSSIILRYSNAVLTAGTGTGVLGYALYSGACPATTSTIACDIGFGFGNGYTIINGLAAGTTYWLRLFSQGANNYVSFNFCVQDVPNPLANNECTAAIGISTQPFGITCAASVSATTVGATHSTPNASCGVSDSNDDIWYSFTASSASIILRYSNAVLVGDNGTGVLGYALYNGSCPSSTTTVACDIGFGFGDGYQIIDGLIAGNTYYLRLFSQGANNYMSFDFCVQNVAPPPVNNECNAAIAISTQPFGIACAASVAATTNGATRSTPDPSCAAADSNDDIWYSFTANSTSIVLRFSNAIYTTTGTDGVLGYALYNGACPSSTTTVSCATGFGFGDGYRIMDGLVIGNTYFLRLYAQGVNNYMSFNFCVQDVPPPPINNECAAAIPVTLTLPGTACLSSVSANTSGATLSANSPSCVAAGSNNDDIWYSFTATAATAIFKFSNCIETNTGSTGSLGYALYNNSCPANASSMVCSNVFGFSSGSVTFTGLTPGNIYILRLFGAGGNNYVSFNFCIQSPLVNDECVGAVNVPVTNGFCTSPVLSSLNGSSTSAGFGSSSCAPGSGSHDVWFNVTVPATGNLLVQTSPVKTAANDLVMTAYTGACGSLVQVACDNDGNPEPFPAADHPRISFTGRTPGEIITLRVTAFFTSQEEQFVICAWDETTSVLPAVSPGGVCIAGAAATIDSTLGNLYRWVPLFDNSGNIIAEVYGDGQVLGSITPELFVNTSGSVRNTNGKYYLDRNMTLNPSVNGAARLRFYFKQTELQALQAVDPTITTAANLRITKTTTDCQPAFSGSPVLIGQQANAAYGINHYLQFNTPSFSSFYIDGLAGVLPLRFILFSGTRAGNRNKLKWIIAKEENIDRIEIQRSSDGIRFITIASQHKYDHVSSSLGEWEYMYTDNQLLPGNNFYRVMLHDTQGRSLYSRIIRLNDDKSDESLVSIFPIPAKNFLQVQVTGASGVLDLEMFDINGRSVKRAVINLSQNSSNVSIGELASGLYMVRVKEMVSGRVQHCRVIKE